jgi:fatty acid desaturase
MDEAQQSLGSLKRIVADCFSVNPGIYWVDLLATACVGWGSFAATELLWARSQVIAGAACVVSIFAFYRGLLFIHELTHRDRQDLPGFSVAWSLLFGTPFFLPSFMYRGVHREHHSKAHYGTPCDGEYFPFGASPWWKSAFFVIQSAVLPAALILRFGLLAPLSLLSPRLRRYVMVHASALTVRFNLPRKIPSGRGLRNWYVQECVCSAWAMGLAALTASGAVRLGTLGHLYGLMVAMFVVNCLRTLVAHRFNHPSEASLTLTEQLLDSVNIEGSPVIAELLCPLGLRYHGLHHLFPAIPYHQLGAAHRRLRAQLPPDGFYQATVEPSFASAFAALWRNTSRALPRPARRPSHDGA